MQTNFHAQLKSLMAQAIGTLKHQIGDNTMKRVTPQTYYIPFAEGSVVWINSQHLLCADGQEYPFDSLHPETLLKLIDEVCTS
jgi:hypothetical protein